MEEEETVQESAQIRDIVEAGEETDTNDNARVRHRTRRHLHGSHSHSRHRGHKRKRSKGEELYSLAGQRREKYRRLEKASTDTSDRQARGIKRKLQEEEEDCLDTEPKKCKREQRQRHSRRRRKHHRSCKGRSNSCPSLEQPSTSCIETPSTSRPHFRSQPTVWPMVRQMRTQIPLYEKFLRHQLLRPSSMVQYSCCDYQCCEHWVSERPSVKSMHRKYHSSDLGVYNYSWGPWRGDSNQ